MRRLSGLLLAAAILVAPVFSQRALAGQDAPQKFTLQGEFVLLRVGIRPGKTGDYEKVLAKLREVLSQSTAPEAKRQMAGWKVMRGSDPLPDGNIIYYHLITPVPGADYSILQVIYQSVKDPAEQKALYDLYSGAYAANLGQVGGSIVADFSR